MSDTINAKSFPICIIYERSSANHFKNLHCVQTNPTDAGVLIKTGTPILEIILFKKILNSIF
jgi:hypothetical protein